MIKSINLKGVKYFAIAIIALAVLAGFGALKAHASSFDGCATIGPGKVGNGNATCVMALQTALNAAGAMPVLSVDGKVGPMTIAAIKWYQGANGLGVDGFAGPMTFAKLVGGATSCTGFDPMTGKPCGGGSTVPGCLPGYMFSPISGAKCDGSSTGGSTTLTGGAGDMTVTDSTTSVENTVYEGDTNTKVMAFKAKADGSDLAVTAVKVTFENNGASGSDSTRLDRYISGVSLWMGSSKVGSVDVSDFTKSGTEYSKTISVSNAVIKENATATFWIAVDAKDSLNTSDLVANNWDLNVNTIRFNDATGAILSSLDLPSQQSFGFDSASANDTTSITSSTANPSSQNFTVKHTSASEEYLVQAFKLKTGTDAGDVQVNSIPVLVTLDDNTSAFSGTSPDAMIDSITLKVGGVTKDADSSPLSPDMTSGDGTALYTFSFDDQELVLNGNSSTEAKLYVHFTGQDNNYDDGATISTSVTGSGIDAESVSNGDTVNVSSSSSSKIHALSLSAPTVSLVGTPSFTSFFSSDTATDVYLAKFTFNVMAGDEDIYLDATGTDVGADQLGNGTINSVTLDADDDSIDDTTIDGDFLVSAGSTEKFTLSFYVNGDNTADKITITDFTYGLNDADRDLQITTGLTNFHTSSVYTAI